MSVRIPIEVSSTGEEKINKIKEGIKEVKKDIDEIEGKISSSDSTNDATGSKSTTKKSKKSKEPKTKIDKALEQDLGFSKANNIISYATNPSGAVLQQLFKIGALPATLIGAPVVAAKVIEFLQQEGNILDRFFDDRIDNRNDALRDKEKLQQILQGFESLRISTIDGNSDPRNIYNSFEVFENNRTLLENDFKIRKNVN